MRIDKRTLYMGTSMAASWAWGSSLMVGSAIVGEKGLLPFMIWAIGNSLMLPFFGFMVKRFPNFEKATNTKSFMFLMTIMQFFITWVNMQAIFMVGTQVGLTPIVAKTLAIAVALAFMLAVYRKGLELAITVDYWEWIFMLIGIAIIVGFGFTLGETKDFMFLNTTGGSSILPNSEPVSHIAWALFGASSLLCGGFIDIQQWQRAKLAIREKRENAFVVGGLMFAAYMILIVAMGVVQFTFWLSVILLIVAILCTTDTLISVGAAMQEIGGNKIGAVLGILAIAAWHFVYEIGIINIWNYYATFRLIIVSVMILTVLIWHYAEHRHALKN